MVVISGVKNAGQLVLAASVLFWKVRLRSINTSNLLPPRPVHPDRALIHLVFPVQPCAGKRKKQKKRKKNTKRQQCLLQYRYDKGSSPSLDNFFFVFATYIYLQCKPKSLYLPICLACI